MSKLFQLTILFCLVFSVSAFAQPSNLPENTEPGKCYAKCLIPDEFDLATSQIETKAAYTKLDVIAPTTETITRQVMVKAPGSELVPVPPTYETVTEQVLIKPESKQLTPVPATYETYTETILVQPASTRIVPVAGSYAPVTDNQVYVGTSNGISTGKGSNPGSFNPADLDAVGSALSTQSVPSSGVINRGGAGSGAGSGAGGGSGNGAGGAGAGNGGAGNGVGSAVNYTAGGSANSNAYGSSAEQLATVGTIMPYLIKAASVRIDRVPMQYESVTETVELKPSTTKWVKRQADKNCLSADPNDCLVWCLVEVPAEYTTVTKQISKGCAAGYTVSGKDGQYGSTSGRDECVKVTQIPAQYGSRQVVQTAPSYREEVIPAQYKTVTKQRIVNPATVQERIVPAEYATVTKQIVKNPAGYVRKAVPAQYNTVSLPQRSGLVLKPGYRWTDSGLVYNANYNGGGAGSGGGANGAGGGSGGNGGYGSTGPMVAGDTPVDPASSEPYSNWGSAGCPSGYSFDTNDNTCKRTIQVPAEYASVTKKAVSKKGGFTEWREVLCSGDVTVSVIRQVQDALRSKGYDPGPTDNVMGSRTKSALVKFQKDNGLPVGQLDFKTLKALGVNY